MATIDKKQITALDLADPITDNNLFLCRQSNVSKRADAQQLADYILPKVKIENDTNPVLGGNLDTNGFYIFDSTRAYTAVNGNDLRIQGDKQLEIEDGGGSVSTTLSKDTLNTALVEATGSVQTPRVNSTSADSLILQGGNDIVELKQATNSENIAIFSQAGIAYQSARLNFDVSADSFIEHNNLDKIILGSSDSILQFDANNRVNYQSNAATTTLNGASVIASTDTETTFSQNVQIAQGNNLANDSGDAILIATSSGAPQLPNTFIYSYNLSANQSISSSSPYVTVQFDTLDSSNSLNAPSPNANYQFVAPVTGYYLLNVYLETNATNSANNLEHNGRFNINSGTTFYEFENANFVMGNSYPHHLTLKGTLHVFLNSGDTIETQIELPSSDTPNIDIKTTSRFSGHLITAG